MSSHVNLRYYVIIKSGPSRKHELFLDDRTNLRVVFLKLLARSDSLELLAPLTRRANGSDAAARCQICATGHAETLGYFLLQCPAAP